VIEEIYPEKIHMVSKSRPSLEALGANPLGISWERHLPFVGGGSRGCAMEVAFSVLARRRAKSDLMQVVIPERENAADRNGKEESLSKAGGGTRRGKN